jgi:hypothetical protein
MSNYWDAYCKTCNVRGGLHINRGDERVAAICRFYAPALAALYRAEQTMNAAEREWVQTVPQVEPRPPWTNTDISIFYSCENGLDLKFFADHDGEGHEMTSIDEAGRMYGICGVYPKEKINGKWLLCGLLVHDDKTPHEFTLVPEWDRGKLPSS